MMAGLTWLGGGRGPSGFCLTFVRGIGEREMFAAFGADPDEVVSCPPGEMPPAAEEWAASFTPWMRAGRSGEWLFSVEYNIPPQGTRPEVLRRISVGAEAVSIYQDIGKLNHEFGYAWDGEVVATLVTSVPRYWRGSRPDYLLPLAEPLGLANGMAPPGDMTEIEALLALAEAGWELSLEQADLSQPLAAARILPVLADLPTQPPANHEFRVGDPTVDRLLADGSPEAIVAELAVRVRRMMAAVGLDAHDVLGEAVRGVLAGIERRVTDDDPVGLALRRLALQCFQIECGLEVGMSPPIGADELRSRVRKGHAAYLLRLVLDGRFRQALAAIARSEASDF